MESPAVPYPEAVARQLVIPVSLQCFDPSGQCKRRSHPQLTRRYAEDRRRSGRIKARHHPVRNRSSEAENNLRLCHLSVNHWRAWRTNL